MNHNYKYELVDGHLVVAAGELRCLIDTGAPSSVCDTAPFELAGKTHPAEGDLMGLTCESVSEDVGTHIDALVGMDVLSHYDMLIDPDTSSIILSDAPLSLEGEAVALDDFMGIPIVEASVGGETIRMFFDTGAKLSYLDPETSNPFPPAGPEEDFHPGVGRYQTDTHRVPVSVGKYEMHIRVGTLPALLQMTLMMADTSGILGTAVLDTHAVCVSPKRQTLFLKKRGR